MSGTLVRPGLNQEGKGASAFCSLAHFLGMLFCRAPARLRQAPPLYWAGFVCHGRSK
jgi:hypothetical protein